MTYVSVQYVLCMYGLWVVVCVCVCMRTCKVCVVYDCLFEVKNYAACVALSHVMGGGYEGASLSECAFTLVCPC